MGDDVVSRGEFTMLVNQVADNSRRLDTIDASGTRGVGVVQSQLMDLKGDVAALAARVDRHDEDHRHDAREQAAARERDARERARERVTARRYRLSTSIGAAAAAAAVLGLLVAILARVH